MKRLIWILLVGSACAQLYPYVPPAPTTGGGAIAQVEAKTVALPNTASGTATITFSTATITGELIVAGAVSPASGQSLSSCTDSASETYTQIYLANANLAYGGGFIQLYYKSNAASGVTTVTCTETNGQGNLFVAHVKNLANNGTLDQSAGPAYNINTAEYLSGGSATGTGNCAVTTFNGGGSGATGTLAASGGVLTAGTAITVTAAGSGYTSVPTTAVLSTGTITCSGTITLTSVGVGGPSTPWNSSPVTTTVANEYLAGLVLGLYNGANCNQSASGSWSKDIAASGGWVSSSGGGAYFGHQIVSSTQTNIENTGTDSGTCGHFALIATFN